MKWYALYKGEHFKVEISFEDIFKSRDRIALVEAIDARFSQLRFVATRVNEMGYLAVLDESMPVDTRLIESECVIDCIRRNRMLLGNAGSTISVAYYLIGLVDITNRSNSTYMCIDAETGEHTWIVGGV